MNRALATIALLILSNTFMTLAWYGHIAFKSKIYGHEIEMYTVEQGEKRDKRQ